MSRPPPCRKGAGRDPRLRDGKGLLRAEHGELGGRDLLGKQLLMGDRGRSWRWWMEMVEMLVGDRGRSSVQPDGGLQLDLIFDLRVFLASVLMRTS